MILPIISDDGTFLSNYFYIYITNDKKINNIYKLLSKYKNLIIQITTTCIDPIFENVILPKKIN